MNEADKKLKYLREDGDAVYIAARLWLGKSKLQDPSAGKTVYPTQAREELIGHFSIDGSKSDYKTARDEAVGDALNRLAEYGIAKRDDRGTYELTDEWFKRLPEEFPEFALPEQNKNKP